MSGGTSELGAARRIVRFTAGLRLADIPPPVVAAAKLHFLDAIGVGLAASTVRKIVARSGTRASIAFPVHPHMLRHATGFYLANEGHDTRAIQHYLGHKQISHTVRYTELRSDRFKGFWTD